MTTSLITGANKGLGRETARQLLDLGHDVWITARDASAGQAAADELGARFVRLDVLDQDSVDDAARVVEREGGLDVLINNAGVAGGSSGALELDPGDVRTLLETNVIGPMRVTRAFAPALKRSDAPAVINVSSSLGSLALATNPEAYEHQFPFPAYPASKAALDMYTVKLARELGDVRVVAVNPGYTATDLNGFQGTQTVQDGARAIVEAADGSPAATTGAFVEAGGTVPW